MRANRILSCALAVAGATFVWAGCQAPPPGRVEIPITKQPARAMNEDLVERPLASRRGAAGTRPVETAVAQSPAVADVGPEPVSVAQNAGKPQAAESATGDAAPGAPTVEPRGATAPTAGARAARPPIPQEPAAKNYGVEQYRLVSQSDEIVSVLKNGMTIIAKRMPSPVLAVRGYVYTGGVYENRWLGGGLSHLLEHLVAGGSSQRRTEAKNRDLLQRIGNNSNAYTTADHTAYFINTTPDHLGEAVDLVTGWMLGALITPEEYKREYEVVQRELEKDKGEPDWVFYHLTQANRYRVSPARVPTIGYQEVIQSLSRDDVFSYYRETYQPNNMVFAVTGDAEPEQMLRAVQKFVDDAPPGRVPSRDIADEPPVLSPRTLVATFPKLGQAKLQIEFPSVRIDHPDLYALDLLSTILGGGESAVLVEELRDKRKLVTSVGASNPTPTFVDGSFEIQMELPPDKIAAATGAVMEVLDNVINNGVSDEQVRSAKVQMRSERVRSLQTSEAVAASLANDLMTAGDPHFTDRYLKRIEEVTPDQLRAVAKTYFVRQRLMTTAMVPAESVGAEGLPKAEDLLRPIAPTTRDAPAAEEKPVITRVELPNGTILLHKRIATSPLVEVKLYALGGVTEESAENNGIGNLTMEMLPRGTATRSAQQVAAFFDSIGGTLDTTCGNNSWAWSFTCLKDDFDKAMHVFADVVNNPAFAPAEVEQMKRRVLAQIESLDADWTSQSMRFFKRQYFGPANSPYQFLPVGQGEIVQKLSPGQLTAWYRDRVLKGRRVLAVFGDVDLERAQAIAREQLGAGPTVNVERPATQTAAADAPQRPPGGGRAAVEVARVEVQKTEQPLAGVVIGYDAHSIIGDAANYPIVVGDTMTSGFGYPTGYLHEILRGRGLVYVVHAINQPGRSAKLPGTFLVYAGCDPGKVNEVVDLILENIARLQGTERDMQPGWFERSKQLAITSDAMDTETPAEQAQTAALDELMGLGYDYHDQFAKRVGAVALDDLRRVARQRLSRAVVTISTPAPEAVKVKPGQRTYAEFPPVDLTPRGVQHDANK
ncbi:MAG TPA: insulinase family protein [Tepidisphaeraceae bacterium]|nr:insulinase family protein [Tepidisphaeraceae bacterium]